jgi:DNA-binding MarR family transcriptional regulator
MKNNLSELAMLIANAGRLLHQRMHEAGGDQFSMLHFKIISFVAERKRASMKEVAKFLGITPPSATVLVNRLVKTGELKRVLDSNDRRTVNVAATVSGVKQLGTCRRQMAKRLSAVVARLTPDENMQLTSILKRLLDVK